MELPGPSRLGAGPPPLPTSTSLSPLFCAHHGCAESSRPRSAFSQVSEQVEGHIDELLSPLTSLPDRQQALFSLEELLAVTQLLGAKGAAWSALRVHLSQSLTSHLAKIHVHVHHERASDFHQHAALEMASCLVILQGLCLADEACRTAAGRKGPMELLLTLLAWSVGASLATSGPVETATSTPSSVALLPSHLLDTLLCLIACHEGARRSFEAARGLQVLDDAVERTEAAEASHARQLTSLKMEQFLVFVHGDQVELEEMAEVELQRQGHATPGAGARSRGSVGGRSSLGSSYSSSSSSNSCSSSGDQSPYASCRSSASSNSSGRSTCTEPDEAAAPSSKIEDGNRQVPRSTPPFRLQVEDTGASPSKGGSAPDSSQAARSSREPPLSARRLRPGLTIAIPATPKRSERHLRDLEQFRNDGGATPRRALAPRTTTPQCSPPTPCSALPASVLSSSKVATRSDSTSTTTTPPFTPRPMHCGPSPAVRRAQARSCSPVKRTLTGGGSGQRLTPESAGMASREDSSSAMIQEGVRIIKSRPLLGGVKVPSLGKGGDAARRGVERARLGRGRKGVGPRLSRSVSPPSRR